MVRAKKPGLGDDRVVDPPRGSDQLLVKIGNVLRRVHRLHRDQMAICSRGTSHHLRQGPFAARAQSRRGRSRLFDLGSNRYSGSPARCGARGID